jgi:hypothetical protein
MTKTSRLLAMTALIAAAFAVSACQWGGETKAADPVAAAVSGEAAAPTAEASATPPAGVAVTAPASSTAAPAGDGAAKSSTPG